MIKDIPTKELAEFLGKTMGFASQIKNGRCKLPPKDVMKVSERFNISPIDLRPDIFGDENGKKR